jgi:hypothetical protein
MVSYGMLCHVALVRTARRNIPEDTILQLECTFHKFLKHHTNILLGDSNAKVDKENIFKPTVANERLHKTSN